MLLCCWWCLRPEAVELDSRRVDHHRVLTCEATAASTAIAAVSLDQWEPESAGAASPPAQRSARRCSPHTSDCLGSLRQRILTGRVTALHPGRRRPKELYSHSGWTNWIVTFIHLQL